MADDTWSEWPFEEVIDFQEGPGILAKDFQENGVPLVRLSGLDRGGSVLEGCNYLDPETVKKRWAHFALQQGDILLSTSASLGRIAVVGVDAIGAVAYTGIIRMRPRDGRLYAPFIRYLLEGPEFQQQAEIVGVGSVIRHFGPMHLRQMSVRLPPPSEQRAIAHILGTLDDKIELNRRMNETLEAIARALFKSWFIDFDPVRRNAARDRNQPSSAASRHPLPLGEGGGEGVIEGNTFDHLFPDSFEDSELGEIPKGWKVGRFGDVVEQHRDQENPLSSPDVLFHHYSLPAFDEGQKPKLEYGKDIKSLKSRVPAGTILLSKLNPEIERVWMVDVRPDERAVSSTEFLVLRARPPFGRNYAYCLARSPIFRQQIEGLVTGTSKSHQRAQVDSILNIEVVIPPSPLIAAFDRFAAGLLERTFVCRREARTLAAQRDALLPKLISGELRLKDLKPLMSAHGAWKAEVP